ncbi:hypothetical protein AtubIFM54640_000498 [Aspergillus tubingensis]|uniref:Hydrophobic surface binding protein A-domain-containing protein n=1 Tax=Aspergillus niger TaxID=5061 RepID=A0A124BVZ5_ASPNG|nr:hydrophobic surface binding protein A-domain-containing protein [Aspergillus tubingensis]GAQ37642.1 hypothetical protein AKAW_00885 [Aspergillus niger]GFN13016.1 hydrophobic surface binding protein A-domain-containing protein [Aspergillus tubingensis]GLA56837.1 hypothetical protein AtubIFM54640_000498 [Aspergillus tubingensis]
MKLSIVSILTLGLAAGSLAAPTAVQERDLPTVTGVLSSIGTKVDALGSAIRAYNGGDVAKVQQASDTLVTAINNGNTKVSSTAALSSGDALGLPGPVNDLKDKITAVINKLDGKKSLIVKAGKGAQTYNDLTQQKAAAKKLSDTIVSKVPENLQSLAGSIAGGISDAIDTGVKDFADQAPKGSKREEAAPLVDAAIAV